MTTFPALARREAGALFLSPALYFTAAFFTLLYGLAFLQGLAAPMAAGERPVAAFDQIALFMSYISLFLTPIVTMRLFADETASGTIELLLTAPVRPVEAVLAKFTGGYLFYLATLLPALAYAVLLDRAGALDRGATAAGFLALALAGTLYVAAGLLASALTASAVVAAAASCGGLLLFALFAEFAVDGGPVRAFLHGLSFVPPLRRMIDANLELADVLYFPFAAGYLLFLTWLAVRARGRFARHRAPLARGPALAVGLLIVAGVACALAAVARLHIQGRFDGTSVVAGRTASPSTHADNADDTPEGTRGVDVAGFVLAGGLFLAAGGLRWRAGRRAEKENNAASLPDPSSPPTDRAIPAEAASTPADPSAEDAARERTARRQRRATVLGAVAVFVALANVNHLARYPWRLFADASAPWRWLSTLQATPRDWSEEGRNTLAPETRDLLDRFAGRVEVSIFLPPEADSDGIGLVEDTRRLFERAQAYNGVLRTRWFDPLRDPASARDELRRLRLPVDAAAGSLAFGHDGRVTVMGSQDLMRPPSTVARAAGRTRPTFDGEAALASMLRALLDPRVPRVYWMADHDELVPRRGAGERSAAMMESLFREWRMEIRPLVFSAETGIPADADLLVLAGPRRPYGAAVAAAVSAYVERGGRVLYAPAPLSATKGGDGPEGAFTRLLARWGGFPRDDAVYDARMNENGYDAFVLGAVLFARGAGSSAANALLPETRTIEDGVEPRDGWQREACLASYPSASRRDGTGRDMAHPAPPYTLGYWSHRAATPTHPASRVAVLGTASMLADAAMARPTNQRFLRATVDFLVDRHARAALEERPWIDRRMTLAAADVRRFQWIALAALPLAWVLAGGWVWWVRKH